MRCVESTNEAVARPRSRTGVIVMCASGAVDSFVLEMCGWAIIASWSSACWPALAQSSNITSVFGEVTGLELDLSIPEASCNDDRGVEIDGASASVGVISDETAFDW